MKRKRYVARFTECFDRKYSNCNPHFAGKYVSQSSGATTDLQDALLVSPCSPKWARKDYEIFPVTIVLDAK